MLAKKILHLFVFSIALSFCLFLNNVNAAEEVDGIAVIVNNDILTKNQVDERIAMTAREMAANHLTVPPAKELRKLVLQNMINFQLQLQQAKTLGLEVDEKKLNMALAMIAKQNHLDTAQLKTAVEQQGINFTQFCKQIKDQIMISGVIEREVKSQVNIPDTEVTAYMQKKHLKGNKAKEQATQTIFRKKLKEATNKWLEELRKTAYIKTVG